MMTAKDWIDGLGMLKHPEGGYFSEIYRCPLTTDCLKGKDDQSDIRNLATSINFLLPSREKSHFHRLKSDELWYFHAGSSLTVHLIEVTGEYRQVKLGLNLKQGERPQVIIPAGVIFGAEVDSEDSYTLMGCVVSPGFDFRDFELMGRRNMIKLHPEHRKVIENLTLPE